MKMRLGTAVDMASHFADSEAPWLRLVLVGALTQPLTNYDVVTETIGGDQTLVYRDAHGPLRALFASGWASRPGAVGPDGTSPELSVWEQTTKHIRAELRVQDRLSLQWGRFHEAAQAGGRQYTTLGIGLDLYYVTLHRSWTVGSGPQQNAFWRLTGRLPLTDSAPDSWLPW